VALLIHVCCAECLLGPLEELRPYPTRGPTAGPDGGRGFTAYFYNPNIHPLLEFRRRLKAVKLLAHNLKLDLLCDQEYGLRDFLERVDWRGQTSPSSAQPPACPQTVGTNQAEPNRCRGCYELRLARTAETAAARGFAAFTTTLLASRRQNHDLVRQVGEEAARRYGVPFAYFDWRPLAEAGHLEAKRRSLYRQQYCGCIFSEFDRYRDSRLHLWPPAARGEGAHGEED